MSQVKWTALGLGAATLPLLVFAALWLGEPLAAQLAADGPAGSHHAAGSEGRSRNVYLAGLTQLYISQHGTEAANVMPASGELAPAEFLNRELEARGLKWRVRTTAGGDAETYDVS